MPSVVASPCCQRSVRNSLVPSRAQACDAPRHGGTTSVSSGIDCAAVLLGLRFRSASAAGKPLVRHTVRVSRAAVSAAVCTLCACVRLLVTAIWIYPSRRVRLNWPTATLRMAWPRPRRRIECVSPPSCTSLPLLAQKYDQHLAD
ncbi:hypothetical protein TcG_13242 [Trypanosoma cruzi]|nr:hypothetical protein TcG_13242 [Trypanosoma cruzi]